MATLNRTFSVKNGIDVANTIIVDSSRNLSNIVTANIGTLNVNSVGATANIATANIINLSVNTISTTESSFANSFISTRTALSAPSTTGFHGERLRIYDFNQAGHPNYAIGAEANHIWVGTDENNGGTGFKWYGNTTAVAVMRSNGTLQLSNTVEAKVIKANGTGTAIDASQGNILTNQVTGTAFNFLAGANTIVLNGSGATANYTFNLPANTGLVGQVLATDGTGDSYWTGEPFVQANAAANLVAIYANNSLIMANANVNFNNTASINVSATANGTNKAANVEFSLNTASIISVGRQTANLTLDSNVTVSQDMTVTGNLFVLGTSTTVETESLVVEDSLIKLANNNSSDALDLGFFGVYNSSNAAGLFRDASDAKFKLFTDYDGVPSTNVVSGIIPAATLVANIEAPLINVTTANAQSLFVVNNANVIGTLNVTGSIVTSNTLSISGAVNLTSTLNVAGTTSLTNTNITGALTITAPQIGLTVANANVTYSLQVGTLNVTTNTVTTSSSGQVVLDKFPTSQLSSAKYFIQVKSGTDLMTTEMIFVHDETNVWITEYGTIQTGPSLGTFSADISSGDVRLLFNATNNVNTIRAARYGMLYMDTIP